MNGLGSSLPLYLIDASAWSHYGSRNPVTGFIDHISHRGVIMTCPPAALEYCFMARNKVEHDNYRMRMEKLLQPLVHPTVHDVLVIQSALRGNGLVRAAGASDTLIATYAMLNNATVISCDKDFGHIAAARDGALRQIQLVP
ncbi:DUF5615 family PIN-like protein [Paeniglutamicibacter psychrophenolicus]|uniref:DUF5615 family PIN-like protein n=1 Tax=Paeniglutamicibacter psychrophenolicus TaxID=257454 RepID=UPI003593B9A3